MNSHENKGTMHQLVRSFVAKQSPILFWRGEWFVWNGAHFEQECQESIEHKAMSFLEQSSERALTGATIHSFVNLLRISQFCKQRAAPVWRNGKASPDPSGLFVVKNGLLNISAAASGDPILLPHDSAFFSLSSVAYKYQPGAQCRRWQHFLNDLWPDDGKAKELLQEWFGYCLLPDTSQQKILAVIGPPRSGKSTIARVLMELIGRRNVASPSIRSLSGQFGLWGLLDKSVAIVPDATLPHPCPALEELLKSISGEDAVDIHRKGLPPLTGVRLPTRIVIVANEQPAFHDPSGALQRRLLTLRTERSFYGNEDITLTEKLVKELPGILNWAIGGWKRLHSRGRFEFPENLSIDQKAMLRAVPDGDRVSRIVVYYDGHRRKRRSPRFRHRQKARRAATKKG